MEETIENSNQQEQTKQEKYAISAPFAAFLEVYEKLSDFDSKLLKAMEFMENSLSKESTPHFRSFWEVRRLCLPLFKEAISPHVRTQHWNRYIELSKEARRLKDLLDEQSAFAVEQIEMAIQALEKDLDLLTEQDHSNDIDLSLFPKSLRQKGNLYGITQRQLDLLNAHASRINALRKELIKTDMRIKHKNKFFQRLSQAGDRVFPARKEHIKNVSQYFIDDINQFFKSNFNQKLDSELLFQLREEVKELQNIAKILTLNTNAFNITREILSNCWDKIKLEDKERKKQKAQQKQIFKEKADQIRSKISSFKESFEKGEISLGEAGKQLEELSKQLISKELGREEVYHLRQELAEIRRPVQEKMQEQENLRRHQEDEKNRLRRENIRLFREKLEKLISGFEKLDVNELESTRDALISELTTLDLSKHEKIELERQFKSIRDQITEKREKALLDLSEDDLNTLNQLHEILAQRLSRRQEIKNQLEQYRKAAGNSGLDFEKAMIFQQQVAIEKERLDKANLSVEEIEKMIQKLES